MTDLSDLTAEQLLDTLARRQNEAIDAEAEEARQKGRFEAIQGVVLDDLKKEGHPVEIAKKLMWGRSEVQDAHEEYLRAMVLFKRAQAAQIRAREAMGLWQTLRADARRV